MGALFARRWWAFGLLFLTPGGEKQAVQHQHDGATDDCHVGDVEGRPVPGFVVEIEKIDDVTMHSAINHIAQRAAHNQRQCSRQPALAGVRQAAQPEQNNSAHTQAEKDKKPALPAGRIRQKAEGRAGIVQQHQVKKR